MGVPTFMYSDLKEENGRNWKRKNGGCQKPFKVLAIPVRCCQTTDLQCLVAMGIAQLMLACGNGYSTFLTSTLSNGQRYKTIWQTFKNNAHLLKGPHLPFELEEDFSIIYKDTLYIIHQDSGNVYGLPTNLDGDWVKIKNIGRLAWREVFPAPIVQQKNIC